MIQRDKDRFIQQYNIEIKQMKDKIQYLRDQIYEISCKKFELQYP